MDKFDILQCSECSMDLTLHDHMFDCSARIRKLESDLAAARERVGKLEDALRDCYNNRCIECGSEIGDIVDEALKAERGSDG